MSGRYRTKDRYTLLAQRDGGEVCFYCKHPLRYKKESEKYRKATFDHFVPRVLGGKGNIDNLVLACAPCNFAKANKLPDSLKDPQG